ncbi:MAG: NAD(P)/FAD-dependent oxidoreductase [Deltaproteobacteria bacterium]
MRSRARRTEAPGEPLSAGAEIGVIGAGPAGTFFALHLLGILATSGRTARISLIDRKAFDCSGPSGCNMCAGAIGAGMIEKMERLGLALDERVVRRIADGYEIHGREVSVTVRNPARGAIYTVFRGGGPTTQRGKARSFDQYLLDAAVARGAEFIHDRVEAIAREGRGFRVDLAGGGRREFDFLVGAFGVNSALHRKLDIGYEPPDTWHTVQAELPADNEFIVNNLRNRIHIVPSVGKNIRFLAITPKDDFLTLTGIGEHVRISDLERERRENRSLADLLPPKAGVICHCHPQVPVGCARNPFADRIAIVGDAFISRYLKNGIESSHDTSRILAEAVAGHGISRKTLGAFFHRPCTERFRRDNIWGKVLFGIFEEVLRKGRLSDAYLRSVTRAAQAGDETQARILWAIFAGDAPYREIARVAFAPGSIVAFWKNFLFG